MRNNGIAGALLVPALLSACSVARLQVDPSLAARVEPMEVTGSNPRIWNKPLAFGPYRTVQVSEGGEWSWTIPILVADVTRSRQRYRFTLTDGERESNIACTKRRTAIERDGWSIDLSRAPLLQCAIRAASDTAPWVLSLIERGTKYEGTIEGAGGVTRSLRLASAHRIEGGRFDNADPVGYTIVQDGKVLAAIETINRGRVWLDPSLSRDDQLLSASLAVALLLFNPGD